MEEVPLLKALHAKYSGQAVLADGKGFDGPVPKAYRIDGTPVLFVLDRAGRIFAKPGSAKQIEAQLQEALARPAQQ
jgi:hypothetical protein